MKSQASMQGSASMLVILIMISLSAFGVLDMITAFSDYKLAQKNVEATQGHYQLDGEAQRRLCVLNESLGAQWRRGVHSSFDDFLETQRDTLQAQGWTLSGQNSTVAEQTVTRDSAHITVRLQLKVPVGDNCFYSVVSWRETREPFDYKKGQSIWNGGIIEE